MSLQSSTPVSNTRLPTRFDISSLVRRELDFQHLAAPNISGDSNSQQAPLPNPISFLARFAQEDFADREDDPDFVVDNNTSEKSDVPRANTKITGKTKKNRQLITTAGIHMLGGVTWAFDRTVNSDYIQTLEARRGCLY